MPEGCHRFSQEEIDKIANIVNEKDEKDEKVALGFLSTIGIGF
jgi:hypothetical protein